LGDVEVITLLEPKKKTEKKPCYSLSRPITGLGPSLSTTQTPLSPISSCGWLKLQITSYCIKINSETTMVG
jgi:hypothetical protein